MQWKRSDLMIAGVVVLTIGTACGSTTIAGSKADGPALGARDVELIYTGGNECAKTDPKDPVIFKSGHIFKPKKVKWKPEVKRKYHWKITWKGGGTNYLGPVQDIACSGQQKTFSKSAKGIADPGLLDWSYSIGVYQCDGTTEVCTADPEIWIDD